MSLVMLLFLVCHPMVVEVELRYTLRFIFPGKRMVRIRFSELDDTVKKFLDRTQQGETIVVEDDNGTVRCGITPYIHASPSEKKAALASLNRLQQHAAQSMTEYGVTEDRIDSELQN